ncbi:MAG: DNA repair protein RadC [Polaribacter sp.]|jgi:DNA repair protein RadC
MNNNTYTRPVMGIKSWAEEDRPREKLLLKGKAILSDAELLAILIGSGSREQTALGLCQSILKSVENDLQLLGKRNIQELTSFKGIGEAKAISIVAALELGRRRQTTDIKTRPVIRSSKDVYNVIAPSIIDLPHEEFWIIMLNRANQVIGKKNISQGGVSGTVVDGKIIFKTAVQALACSIILCHNHPSGNLTPSQADIDITRKLRKAGEAIDISVIDHLIVSEQGYYSFGDEGVLG